MDFKLDGLVLLLLFIAPGFLYSRAYLAAKPRYQKAPDLFEQTVLAVVGSTIVHACLLGLIGGVVLSALALIYNAQLGHTLLVREIFYIPQTSAADIPVSVLGVYLVVATMYLSASLFLAHRAGNWLGGLPPERAPRWYRSLAGGAPQQQVLLWYSTLVEEPLRRGTVTPRIVAWLRSGERFEGDLVEFRLSADETSVIELAIADATVQAKAGDLERKSSDRTAPKPTALLHHRVLLRSSDILWLGRVDKAGVA